MWVNAPVHTGIALDGLRRKLYIALKSSAAILVFDLATEPPQGSVYTNLADDVNDLAIAPDGTRSSRSRIAFDESGRPYLYVANPAGPMRRISTDSRGLRQP